ncbi:ATPase central domain-containing protein [Streptomyces lincolnensis]|uniref:ATPase central domain-containing protein n=1 Tax=Streptomyces lincolnensis TaxID=1915 RepID=A0A1B1MQ71_STRLN|nr:MoxR family ATPase [Streptomyces lincolnensis]ANS70745.1 ATPase central domain-containing protein [Streptomyces lincolnensis]
MAAAEATKDWWIYQGAGTPADRQARLTEHRPPWRAFKGEPDPGYTPPGTFGAAWDETLSRGAGYVPDEAEIDAVNTALYLRRPLLVTGKPGVGKSTLAHSIAADLELGPVLHWPITSRSSLRDGLYQYDAIGRLHDANLRHLDAAAAALVKGQHSADKLTPRQPTSITSPPPAAGPRTPGGPIAPYLRLGPLGTALVAQERPRVLLVDEIDKSDIDLPGDLLTVFEEGSFEIPELARIAAHQSKVKIGTQDDPEPHVEIERGRVQCLSFPIIVLTSNGERDFPPPFLRRCIRLNVEAPSREKLTQIVRQRLDLQAGADEPYHDLIEAFLTRRVEGDLATDQLLNAVQLRLSGAWSDDGDRTTFLDTVLQRLTGPLT